MSKRDRFKLIGNTIAGTFRVDDVVAEGGFGVVYRAFHLHFRSPVALKCLKIPGELSDEERQKFLEQFRSEAEIQFRLSAALPQVVRPLHIDALHTDDGDFVPMMALEWLEGRSFEKIIEYRTFSDQPPMSLVEVVDLIGPAAQALHQAHCFEVDGETLTVVHRDIKPDNLFVTQIGGKDVVKILDFGISKVRRAASQLAGHFSQTEGTAPFSPAYGAPEQWVPKRFGQTGPWTDVWGLALTLVEIIKGDPVIVGDHQAMMGTVLDPKKRPTPRQEGLIVSDDVEDVFAKALALDPRYRYQSIEAFWQALQRAIELSGDFAQKYDETPSGSRIPLPPMSAPTPWASPVLPREPQPFEGLPAMVVPAKLQPTRPEDLDEEMPSSQSYPFDPASDLQPVPAAPTSWHHFDPDVPPSSVDDSGITDVPPPLSEPSDSLATGSSAVPSLGELPDLRTLAVGADVPDPFAPPIFPDDQASNAAPSSRRRDPSIKLELEPTSVFPKRRESTPADGPVLPPQAAIPDLLPQATETPSRKRPSGARRRGQGAAGLPAGAPPAAVSQPATSRPPPAPSLRAPRPAPSPERGQPPPPPRRDAAASRGAEGKKGTSSRGGPPPLPSRAAPPPPPNRNVEAGPNASDDDDEAPLSLVPPRRSRSTGSR